MGSKCESVKEVHCIKSAMKLSILKIAYSHKNNFFVTGSGGGECKIWNLKTDHPQKMILNAHYDAVENSRLLIGTNKKIVITNSKADVSLFNFETSEFITNLNITVPCKALDVSTQKETFVVGSEKSFKLYTASNNTLIHHFENAHGGNVTGLKLLKEGTLILSTSSDCSIKIWDVEAKKMITESKNAHASDINGIDVSGDEDSIYSASKDNSIKIWKREDLSLIHTIEKAHEKEILGILVSKKGTTFATFSLDLSIKVWEIGTHKLLHTFSNAHKIRINSISISDDGQFIASGGKEMHLKIWSTKTNCLVHQFSRAHENSILSVSFTDGENPYIVTSSSDYCCKVWRLQDAIDFNFSEESNGYHYTKIENYIPSRRVHKVPIKDLSDKIISISTSEYPAYTPVTPDFAFKGSLLVTNHSWNLYHYYAVKFPGEITTLGVPDYNNISFLDAYDKTPLHYLIAYKDSKYAASISHVFKIIVDFLESIREKRPYDFARTMDSLSQIMNYIFTKINSMTDIHRFLKLCNNETQFSYGLTPVVFGDVKEDLYHKSSMPVIVDYNILNKIYSKEESYRVTVCTTYMPMDFNLRSDRALKFILMMKDEKRRFFYEDPFIIAILSSLWDDSKKMIKYNATVFSLLMSLLTLNIVLGIDSDDHIVQLSIVIVTLLLMGYELMQALISGFADHFDDFWNITDLLTYILILLGIGLQYANNEFVQENEIIPWIFTFCMIFGYLRWISYLRVIDQTRYLIRIVIVIFNDIKSFMLVVFFIIICFYTTLMLFNYDEGQPLQNLFNAYLLLYSPLDGEMSSSQQIISVIYPFVLNVVFLNMLISIMGDSYSKVKDEIMFADNSEKIDMIHEAALIQRFLRGPPREERLEYLIKCEYTQQEEENEIQQKQKHKEIVDAISLVKMKIDNSNNNDVLQKIEDFQEAVQKKIEDIQTKEKELQASVEKKFQSMEDKIQAVEKSVEKAVEKSNQVKIESDKIALEQLKNNLEDQIRLVNQRIEESEQKNREYFEKLFDLIRSQNPSKPQEIVQVPVAAEAQLEELKEDEGKAEVKDLVKPEEKLEEKADEKIEQVIEIKTEKNIEVIAEKKSEINEGGNE